MKINIQVDNKRFIPPRLSLLIHILLILFIFLFLSFIPKNPAEVFTLEEIPEVEAQYEHVSPQPIEYLEIITKGKTLSDILEKYKFSVQEIHKLREEVKPIYDLSKIKASNQINLYFSPEENFLFMKYEIDKDEYVEIKKEEGQYSAEIKKYPYSTEIHMIWGYITDNLMASVSQEGEQDMLALMLAEIFAWDIDFHTDLRINDRFKIIFEKKILEDRFISYGNIIAAEFVNQGKKYQAFRYMYPDTKKWDYFDYEGNSLRKEFLKSPLKFARISSRYSLSRLHPIHKVYRPHLGVDYAAPTGTSVQVTASGTVISVGWNGGGGRTIRVRHNNSYETYYMHLNHYAKGIKKGAKIEGGQVIGYVGATGDATGPHLDYRIKYMGKFINPLAWRFQPVEPLRTEFKANFQITARDYLSTFDTPLFLFAKYIDLSFPSFLSSTPEFLNSDQGETKPDLSPEN